YRVSGGKITFDRQTSDGWQSGNACDIHEVEGDLLFDGETFRKATNPTGAKLEGTYVNTNYVNLTNQQAQISGAVVSEHTLSFQSNGRFSKTGNRVVGINGGAAADDGAESDSGTYELRDWTLILTYQDGHQERSTFFR